MRHEGSNDIKPDSKRFSVSGCTLNFESAVYKTIKSMYLRDCLHRSDIKLSKTKEEEDRRRKRKVGLLFLRGYIVYLLAHLLSSSKRLRYG